MRWLRNLLARLFRPREANATQSEDPRDVRLTAEARGHAGAYYPDDP